MRKIEIFLLKKWMDYDSEKLQFVDGNGNRVIGPVFMQGTFLYVYGKDGIYTMG
ncbi:hypothetical protein [Ornithinibacillus halophilus]|uniref:hypothetical protein n=1 Tax=Ornithinibacillus halophilus TaxID=930117 RepID=UPI00135628BD|nr:hypothetical protein [Ornithinibacillus halophilus]